MKEYPPPPALATQPQEKRDPRLDALLDAQVLLDVLHERATRPELGGASVDELVAVVGGVDRLDAARREVTAARRALDPLGRPASRRVRRVLAAKR